MKDKDRLILIIHIGLEFIESKENQARYFWQVIEKFTNEFDESIHPIVVPDYDSSTVNISKLNEENYSEEYINSLMEKAEQLINKLKDEYRNT